MFFFSQTLSYPSPRRHIVSFQSPTKVIAENRTSEKISKQSAFQSGQTIIWPSINSASQCINRSCKRFLTSSSNSSQTHQHKHSWCKTLGNSWCCSSQMVAIQPPFCTSSPVLCSWLRVEDLQSLNLAWHWCENLPGDYGIFEGFPTNFRWSFLCSFFFCCEILVHDSISKGPFLISADLP